VNLKARRAGIGSRVRSAVRVRLGAARGLQRSTHGRLTHHGGTRRAHLHGRHRRQLPDRARRPRRPADAGGAARGGGTGGGSALVGTPLLSAGSATVNAAPGDYVIHVVGTPGNVPGSGTIGIQVTNTANNSVLAAFADTLALPNQALPSSEAVLDDTFSPSA